MNTGLADNSENKRAKTTTGREARIVRGDMWFITNTQVLLNNFLIDQPIVTIDPAGIQQTESIIRQALAEASGPANPLFDANYTVLTVPKETDITDTDRQNNKMSGFKATVRYQNAVHSFEFEVITTN